MKLDRIGVGGFEDLGRAGQRGVHIAGVQDNVGLDRLAAANTQVEVVIIRQRSASRPCDFQQPGSLNGLFFAFGNHAQKITFPYDFHQSGHTAHGALIDTDEGTSDLRGPDNPAMEHHGDPNVMYIAE